VGAVFLGATWLTVLRGDTDRIRAYGLSLGGVTEPEAIDFRRLAKSGLVAVGWALVLGAVFFPPFWLAYKWAWTETPFVWRMPEDFASRALGQLLVIALPEEAFFRGYLQSSLDGAWADKRWRILGADIGLGWLLASFIFAAGHVLTIPNPARLGVFFPALVFGWVRARTGGIGAAVLFHAMCNLLSAFLAHGYGLAGG
jgi:membrane protease YdiL (CAAX protease family)